MAFTFSTSPSYDNQMPASGSGADEIGIYTTLTGPASYTTGGESFVVARDFGVSAIKHFSCEVNAASATDVIVLVYDRTNTKLIALDEAGTQISNGTDLSARTFRVRILGTRKNFSS
jgi:hypothetical protein